MIRNFLVCKSNDAKSQSFQVFFALSIIFLLCFMNTAIYFHDQFLLVTIKIRKIPVNYLLSAKVKAVQLIGFQVLSQSLFSRSHILS